MNLDEFTTKEKLFILLFAFVVTCEGYKKATGIDILKDVLLFYRIQEWTMLFYSLQKTPVNI